MKFEWRLLVPDETIEDIIIPNTQEPLNVLTFSPPLKLIHAEREDFRYCYVMTANPRRYFYIQEALDYQFHGIVTIGNSELKFGAFYSAFWKIPPLDNGNFLLEVIS